MPGSRILVVDDDPDIIDYFTSFLGDHGYEVGSAVSSADALGIVDAFQPDAVLIDVMMPGKSGLDLLVTLRRDARWAGIPLVMVTGSDQILQDDCQSYLGAHDGVRGPDGVLGKPVDRATLLAVLRHLPSRSEIAEV
jgi:CheY-like chemotaxis protein